MNPYHTLNKTDIKTLSAICETVTEPGEDYARDEMPIYGEYLPEAAVFPVSVDEVSKIVVYCHENNIPLTVRGAGTGLCGGAVAKFGGVLMCMEKMNRILELDEQNMTATVEPGVLLMDFSAYVLEHDLFYPPEPGEKSATLGGNVMTNAGGMKAVKYGVTRDYVLGLEAVLPDGRVINVGGKLAKNCSGYSLLHLLIGSEGTLAVTTKIILKLIPKPQKYISLLVPFNSLEDCINAVPAILLANLSPVAVEFIQREVILEAEQYLGKEFPDKSADAYLLLSFDGRNREETELVCDRAAEVCLSAGARDALFADTAERLAGLWDARGAFLEAIKSSTDEMDECDVVVPRDKIAAFVQYSATLEKEYGVRIRYFGHAGDGNIHVYVCRDGMEENAWRQKLDKVMDALYARSRELGGKVSGEHGIGHAKIEFLHQSEGDLFMELMGNIKRAFDPKNILNPGKLVDL